jgi:hypothetical protein
MPKTMWTIKCVMSVAALLVVGGLATAGAPDDQPQRARGRGAASTAAGELAAVDAEKSTVTISVFSRQDQQTTDKTFPVAKDATILQDGGKVKLADLKKGFRAALTLSPDQKTVTGISVDGGTVHGQFRSANVDRNTIRVIAGRDMALKTFHLVRETKIALDGGKEGTIKDLKPGTMLVLTLSVEDRNTVIGIRPTLRQEDERE